MHLYAACGLFSSQSSKLVNDSMCASDINVHCSHATTDPEILWCLTQQKVVPTLDEKCHHQVWARQLEIAHYSQFKLSLANQRVCDIDRMSLCDTESDQQALFCLLRKLGHVQDKTCYEAVKFMGPLIFHDSHVIDEFLGACREDIHRYQCGRTTGQLAPREKYTSQQAVLSCLALHNDKLPSKCRSQMADLERLIEKVPTLDPELYGACKDHILKWCASDEHEGPVHCLLQYVDKPEFSNDCKVVIHERIRTISTAPQLHMNFYVACKQDIEYFHCEQAAHKSTVGIHELVACLQNGAEAYRNKLSHHPISVKCHHELFAVQREMLTDLGFNSHLIKSCEKPLTTLCHMNVTLPDKGLFSCLIKNSMTPSKRDEYFTGDCLMQIDRMVNITNLVRHPNLDPILATECSEILLDKCFPRSERTKEMHAYLLLECISKLRLDPVMNAACTRSLHMYVIFGIKNATVAGPVRQACEPDLQRFCFGGKNALLFRRMGGPADLLCLLRHRDLSVASSEGKLSEKCYTQVTKYYEALTKSMYLNPLLFESCSHDLVVICHASMEYQFTPDEVTYAQERDPYDCLLKNYQKLQPGCQQATKAVAEAFGGSPMRHHVLKDKCELMAAKSCPGVKNQPQKLIICLLEKKHEIEDQDCLDAIVAWTSTDHMYWGPSNTLFRECSVDVKKYCAIHVPNGAASVTRCLVARFVDKMLSSETNPWISLPLTSRCHDAIHLELMIEHTFILMNPDLLESCRWEMANFCSRNEVSGLQCLRKNSRRLSEKCHAAVFRQQMIEAADNSLDQELLAACSSWINRECAAELSELQKHVHSNDQARRRASQDSVLSCLIAYQVKANEKKVERPIDGECKEVLHARMAERSEDYRLDPQLKQKCDMDIRKHCSLYMNSPDVESRRHKVLDCLRRRYIRPSEGALEPQCIPHVHRLVVLSNMNYHLDPQLKTSCEQEIRQFCQLAVVQIESEDDMGLVTDCLKKHLKAGKITSQACKDQLVRSVSEGAVDAEADAVLFNACVVDLATTCADAPNSYGQIMTCLMYNLQANKLTPSCAEQMKARRELWSYVGHSAAIESMADVIAVFEKHGVLYKAIYFLLAMLGFACVLTFTLGRMTRRPAVLKNQ